MGLPTWQRDVPQADTWWKKGRGNSLQKRPAWKKEWFLSACLQPDVVFIQVGKGEMQSKGEKSKGSSQKSKTQARSEEVWKTESSCGAWTVLTCVAVHLNCVPQCLKNALIFSPRSYSLALSNCFQLDVSRMHFSQVCSCSFTRSFFLSVGIGNGGSAPCSVRGWAEPHRGTAPVAASTPALAQPRSAMLIPPLSTHVYNHFKQENCYPKLLASAWKKAKWGDYYCKGLWGSWCGRTTAAPLPWHPWAWRFSLIRNGNIAAYGFSFI